MMHLMIHKAQKIASASCSPKSEPGTVKSERGDRQGRGA